MIKKIEIYFTTFREGCKSAGCKYTLLLAIILFSIKTNALPINTMLTCGDPSPKLTCSSVQPNGDVALTWLTPANTGVFDSYHIFRSYAPGGPFVVVDSIFVAGQTTYTDVGANANTSAVYYYIETRCASKNFSPPFDTLHTIFLNVSNPANGTALLTWKPVASNTINTYSIYQKISAGAWTITGSKINPAGGTASISFIDTIFNCNATINYRVTLNDASGCTSVSSSSGGTFQNTISPGVPAFDTMSVDDNNKTMLSWKVSQSTDVAGYVIYQFNGTSWIPVDSVLGINNTGYTYPSSNPNSNSEQYRLAAYDSCGNISLQGAVYKTMYLTSVADICKRSANLSWTAYTTFNSGLSHYLIFQSTAGQAGPYSLLGSVPAGTLTYTASGLNPGTTYYYKIQAVDNSGTKTSSSNRISFYSATPVAPQFLYLQKVSVSGANQIDLTCHIDVNSPSSEFKILRSTDTVSANFIQIGTVPKSNTTPISFTDNKVTTNSLSYYYKVISVDSCGYDGLESNVSRTMLLTITSNNKVSTNTLTWNDYQYWSGGVSSYNIYRGIDGTMDPAPIANIPFTSAGINTYTDDVSLFLVGQGIFSYYIEAVEGAGNTYGFKETSLSNVAQGYQDSKIFIPNAFVPEGIFNPVFKPVTTYVETSDYVFRVFNRMGLQVFTTENLSEGWDGTYKGSKCEFGVYVYLIRFKSSRGEYIDLKGSVTLLR